MTRRPHPSNSEPSPQPNDQPSRSVDTLLVIVGLALSVGSIPVLASAADELGSLDAVGKLLIWLLMLGTGFLLSFVGVMRRISLGQMSRRDRWVTIIGYVTLMAVVVTVSITIWRSFDDSGEPIPPPAPAPEMEDFEG